MSCGAVRVRADRVQLAADRTVAAGRSAITTRVASAISTTPGTPATVALVMSSQACGTWSALTCLPPA